MSGSISLISDERSSFSPPVDRPRGDDRPRLVKSGRRLPPAHGRRWAGAVFVPVRWACMLGILISLRVRFELAMDRPGLLAALAVYAAIAAGLPHFQARRPTRHGSERLMLAADLLFSGIISHLSGGLRSPYYGLWYLAMIHAALVLRPSAAFGVAAGAAAAVIVNELCFAADGLAPLHPFIMLGKLSVFPLIAWAGSRLAQELRERDVARRQAMRQAAASESEEARVRQEMEGARRVQESLLPRSFPAPNGVSLAALFCPAEEVGGDIYDVIELADGRLLVAVADVCGKGVPAAMLAVAVQLGIRQFAGPDPAAVLADLNQLLVDRCPDHMFVTAVCMVLDPWDGWVEAATAGHPPPLRWHQDGRRLSSLRSRGMALGLEPEWIGQTDQFTLSPGDALLLYTDGVVDARVGSSERLGVEGVSRRLGETSPQDANSWLAGLLHTLCECAAWPDDVTAVAVVRSLPLRRRQDNENC